MIPGSLRENVLNELHAEDIEIHITKLIARSYVYWNDFSYLFSSFVAIVIYFRHQFYISK